MNSGLCAPAVASEDVLSSFCKDSACLLVCPSVLSAIFSGTLLGAILWILSGSAASSAVLFSALSVSALCLQIEAIAVTQGCSQVCSAVSLIVGSG